MNIQDIFFTLQGNVTQLNLSSLELWLSFGAVIISIVSFAWQTYKEDKYHKTNLESSYFNDIYMKYLIKEIPEGRKRIAFNNGRLSGTDNIITTLNNIRQDSLYFMFNDKKYYDNICDKLQKLEDKYVEVDELTNEQFVIFLSDTENMMSEIYKIITNKYHGNKRKFWQK